MTMQERLRLHDMNAGGLMAQAADHIDQLEADKAELVEALAMYASNVIMSVQGTRHAQAVLAKHKRES